MDTRNIDTLKNELLKNRITISDTISQFMEKCNNNFSAIIEWGGGPAGEEGDDGKQGVPTKPKVPIHIWREGIEYKSETTTNNPDVPFEILEWYEDLSDPKYQDGHLIMLKNGRVYILEVDNYTFNLKPKYIISLSTYNPSDVIDGKNAYVHIAYANAPNSRDGFITDQQLRNEYGGEPAVATFNLRRNANNSDSIVEDRPYMGIYSDNLPSSAEEPYRYTWVRIQGGVGLTGERGEPGPAGPAGPQGDPGDGYTGQPYTIDLEGDMSTISIDIDRTRLYDDSEDYCECTLHAYYGDENVRLNIGEVSIKLPEEYKYSGNNIVLKSDENSKVGKIEKLQKGNDVNIKFTPDETFVFPKKTIIFPIHVETTIDDDNDGKTYEFVRDCVWMIKGIASTFELEILPQYRSIKLFEDGEYYPKKLLVSVYKVEDAERTIFNFEENPNFKLLYKNYNSNTWIEYPTDGVDTEGVSCLEFKVVRYYNTPEEEIWDYEDVWVVADGKGTHYYHADLGSTESMMVLTTGEKINIGTEDEPKYCAELRNESGYSITFEPKFYDGAEELEIENVSIGTNSGDEYYANGTFVRELKKEVVDDIAKYTLTVSKVPYDIEMIPMSIDVRAKCPIYDNNGNFVEDDHKNDSVSFNVYISTLSNTYTLVPTVSTYNTSTGKTGDTIGCNVYKNNTIIPTDELDRNALKLEYAVHDGGTDEANIITYTEPLVYGDDDDIEEDEFTAKDVAIEFILSYRNKEIVRSIVPLVKDGIDGRDGDSWQYIFCRSPKYPFGETGISDPSTWIDDKPNDSNNELLGNNGVADSNWYDDHKGVSSEYRYEYQSYRKWDKDNKCWGKYGSPTLYSNYSESGSGYSVMLSNPIAVIPVGDGENDWSVDENNSNQSDSTLVYLFNNISDMSNDTKVTISLPENNEYVKKGNFSKTKENNVNKVIFKPVVGDSIFDFGTNAQYKLPITLTYSLGEDLDNDGVIDEFTSTINWTLSPIKGLYDVEVFVNKRVVNTSTSNIHYLQVGYYLISSTKTKKFIENHNVDNTNGYKIILTDDIGNLSSNNVVSDWQNATYNFFINGKNRNCYVVLVESDGKTIIDYTNVTAINDGASAIHLELDQDSISLPCSVDGNAVHPDYDVNQHPIYSRMRLYNGDKLIEDYDKITYSFSDAISGSSLTGFHMDGKGGFDVPKDIITGDMIIQCTAEYNGSSFHKTLFIDLEVTPYELELSKNILTRDGDSKKIKDDKLIVRVKYWSGVDGKWVYTGDGVVKASTPKGQENLYFGNASGDLKERTLIISGSTLANNTTDTEVKISYYKDKSSTDVLSYENIGIISEGKTGSAPSCTSTKILGYSLVELDINSANWKTSLNDLGDTTPGQPIYILNEYGWSDGTKTKGITVTLAGTQGVAGKSRVLFYLGSFYDGTLSGTSVQGTLDDERCDYYIDKNNKAWMRTGTAKTATGSSSGNTNDPNWKESTKVGFLQAGAIHADMINTNSITANSALVTTLFAQDITAENLKVNAAKIQGQLTASQIATGVIPEGLDRDDVTKIIGETEIDGGKIRTDSITAAQIKAHSITANEIATGVIPEDLDIDWLKTAFNDGSTILSNGLILSTFIAVSGNNGPESGLNSSTKIKSGRDDYDDKKLLFFAGSNGLKTSAGGSTNISSNSTSGYTSNAKIEFFSDGSGYVAGDRFKWDNTGKATIQNLIIENSILNGSIRSPFKHIDTSWTLDGWGEDDPDKQKLYDNLYCSVGGYYLPWTWGTENIGRHITLVHNRNGKQITDYGTCHIEAPDGYYFFEDGVARKKLDFSNEIIDLIGYGNEQGTFHGWIVNKRDNIMTKSKYGHALKCLCFGRVIFNSDSVYISNLKTFDGTSTSSSYHISQRFSITSNTNYCTITMPECWFNGSANKNLYVELSPVYNTRIPQVALGTISDNSFTVYVDKSPAAFDFMLYNKNDWFSFTDEFVYDKIVYVENTSTTYRSIWLSNISGDLGDISGFVTNASSGLTVEYVSGDASWVNYSISNGKLTASTTAGNTTASDRSCIVRIKPKSISGNEIIKDGVANYIDITLGQRGTPSGGGGWT